jgi:methionyl-tRNA formyltransferase
MSKEESQLDFSLPAQQLHNKVRAFAGWPGTTASFTLVDEASGKTEDVEYKVVRTRVADAGAVAGSSGADAEVVLASASMYVRCGGGSVLEVLQVQPPGKKVMGVKDLKNGLGKRKLLVRPAAAQVAA